MVMRDLLEPGGTCQACVHLQVRFCPNCIQCAMRGMYVNSNRCMNARSCALNCTGTCVRMAVQMLMGWPALHGMQNATRTPLLCAMALKRHVTLSSNTHRVPHDSVTTVWSSSEGPIPPSRHATQPCYGILRIAADPPAMPTLHGDLVQCRYSLECSGRPARGCCAAVARVEVPIRVQLPHDDAAEWTAPEAPPGWRPEVMAAKVRCTLPLWCCTEVIRMQCALAWKCAFAWKCARWRQRHAACAACCTERSRGACRCSTCRACLASRPASTAAAASTQRAARVRRPRLSGSRTAQMARSRHCITTCRAI